MERRVNYPLPNPIDKRIPDFRHPDFNPSKIDFINVFEKDPVINKKLMFLNRTLDYGNASKPEKKKILQEIAKELVVNPNDCLFFYQTLREYEEVNKGDFYNLFLDIRNKLPAYLRESATVEMIRDLKTEKDQTDYFAPLLKFLPDLEDPQKKDQSTTEIDFAKAAKEILRGFIKSSDDPEKITNILYGLNLGVFSFREETYEKYFYDLYAGLTNIFTPEDEQMIMYSAAIYSDSDETVRKFFIVDRIATLLQGKYYSDNQFILNNTIKAGKRFPDLFKTYQNAAMNRNENRFKQIFNFQRDYLFADKDIISIEDDLSYFDKPLSFPFSVLYQPSTLWYEYVRLAQELYKIKLQTITIPQDGTVRTVIVDKEHGSFNVEEILRKQYLVGKEKTINNRFFLRDVLIYLKPEYQDNSSDLYQKAELSINESLINIKTGLVTVHLNIGKYQLPLYFDILNNRLIFIDGSTITEVNNENLALWQDYISGGVLNFITVKRKELMQKNRSIENKEQVKQLLNMFYPFSLDTENREVISLVADKKQELLKEGEDQRVIHPFGTLIKVKENDLTDVSSLLFSYSNNGQINVSIILGKLQIDLRLDNNFNLKLTDGGNIDLPLEIVNWWKSLIFSHLTEYLFTTEKTAIDESYFIGLSPDERETANYIHICRPYRRRLQEGYKLNPHHSIEIENHPGMKAIVAKTARNSNETFLGAYNRAHSREDGRLWNWVLPPSDERIEELIKEGKIVNKPIIINTPQALNYLKK